MSRSGNYIAEWFGYRVWPPEEVDESVEAVRCQSGRLCPFISAATGSPSPCAKQGRTGFCTASSDSNGPREDWLACPFRVLDADYSLLTAAVRTVFGVLPDEAVSLIPITLLKQADRQSVILDTLRGGLGRVFVFAGTKMGGEVDIPETPNSPGFKVDFSVTEATLSDPSSPMPLAFGGVMMFEVQTADFHGTPKHAVARLEEVCPPGEPSGYHERLKADGSLAGDGMEGPNKANIFKRTIYQMLFKMELARDPSFAGFAIIIPAAVWGSWQKHLGAPTLSPDSIDPLLFRLPKPEAVQPENGDQAIVLPEPAWIFVFDIDKESTASPQPPKVLMKIATDSTALMHFAFDAAVRRTIQSGAFESFRDVLLRRIAAQWRLGLPPSPPTRKSRSQRQ